MKHESDLKDKTDSKIENVNMCGLFKKKKKTTSGIYQTGTAWGVSLTC